MDNCSRYFFVVVNVFFLVLGVLMLGLSVWLQYASPIHEMLVVEQTSRVVIYAVLVLGCFILFIGLCGVIGGVFLKLPLLAIYVVANGTIMIIVLVFLIYGVSNKDVLVNETTNVWNSLSDDLKYIIQNRFNCCGFWNSTDWDGSTLHASCIENNTTNTPWQVGCYTSTLKWVGENAVVFGLIVGFLFLLMVLQTAITIYLMCNMRQNKTQDAKKQSNDDLTNLTERNLPKDN